jgi:2-polyprenyl-3-methyl-5-hydroxy-6-metoxy-1,4-benzoquinol methylase
MGSDGPAYQVTDRQEMLRFVPTDVRAVLDVGCSRGGFGRLLRSAVPHARLRGIEPDAAAAEEARPHYDQLDVALFDPTLINERFDVIVCNDVLEHMLDPWIVLRDMHPLLSERGVVVASIPNIRYLPVLMALVIRGRWDYTETGTLDRTHLRFFTRTSIRAMFEQAGYDIEVMAPLNEYSPRGWVRQVLRLLLRGGSKDLLALQFGVVARPRP